MEEIRRIYKGETNEEEVMDEVIRQRNIKLCLLRIVASMEKGVSSYRFPYIDKAAENYMDARCIDYDSKDFKPNKERLAIADNFGGEVR